MYCLRYLSIILNWISVSLPCFRVVKTYDIFTNVEARSVNYKCFASYLRIWFTWYKSYIFIKKIYRAKSYPCHRDLFMIGIMRFKKYHNMYHETIQECGAKRRVPLASLAKYQPRVLRKYPTKIIHNVHIIDNFHFCSFINHNVLIYNYELFIYIQYDKVIDYLYLIFQ